MEKKILVLIGHACRHALILSRHATTCMVLYMPLALIIQYGATGIVEVIPVPTRIIINLSSIPVCTLVGTTPASKKVNLG